MGMAESIGKRLKAARDQQGLSLDEISLATHIKETYLQAMEEDRFEELPSPVQQRGFLRAYALQLGLAPGPLVDQLTGRPAEQPEIDSGRGESGQTGEEKPGLPAADPPSEDAEESAVREVPNRAEKEFQGIGESLRTKREQLGLTLQDIDNQIHIPVRYLKAIEEGRLEELPSTVQGRGMLKNYSSHLGLDSERLLLRYADVLRERLRELQPPPGSSLESGLKLPLWMRRTFRGSSLLGVVIVLMVSLALIWSAVQVFGGGSPDPDATKAIPGVADVLLPSPTGAATATLTATPSTPQGAAEGELPQAPTETAEEQETQPVNPTPGTAEVQVQLIVTQRSFVEVRIDGEVVFSGRMLPGSVHLYGGEDRIEITTGNAGGVEIIFNQRDLGVLGVYGQVVSRIFTSEGIATATPTVTPTPTVTDTPTPTSTLTPTPLQP